MNPAGTTELLRRKFERDTVLTAPDRCPDHEWCDPARWLNPARSRELSDLIAHMTNPEQENS